MLQKLCRNYPICFSFSSQSDQAECNKLSRVAEPLIWYTHFDCMTFHHSFIFLFADSESIFVVSSHYFTSPNYPTNYPNSLQYTWYLSTYPGLKLLLSFIDINTEYLHDYITVNNGNSSFSEELLLRLSGQVSPNKVRIISSESDISVTFETDTIVAMDGFAALVVVTCLERDRKFFKGSGKTTNNFEK